MLLRALVCGHLRGQLQEPVRPAPLLDPSSRVRGPAPSASLPSSVGPRPRTVCEEQSVKATVLGALRAELR